MSTSRTRLTAITGATLALVMAGTAVTAAHGRHDDRGYGFRSGPGPFVEPFGLGDRGPLGGHGLRLGLMGLADGFVRSETTLDLGDEGIVTHRSDNGSVTSASDSALDYTLATGEGASVLIGEDTTVWALTQASSDDGLRPFRRVRLMTEQIVPEDIALGSEVMVSATSQEDGSFLASRIVVKPIAEVAEDTDAAVEVTEDATTDDAAEVATDA